MNNDELKKIYKQLELLIGSVYEKYRDQFSSKDREDYEEMFAQGEYELVMETLLGSIKEHSIKLDSISEDTVNKIYKLMEIERPVIE
ncbi:MAG: hypothetical protein R3B41_03760 [Candidatus Doudnabacteria bacterium]